MGTRIGQKSLQDVEALEIVVTVWRRFATVLPGQQRNLANSLRHLARALLAQGRLDDALTAVEESVRICRPRVAARPVRYGRELAWSLIAQAMALERLERWEHAYAAADESTGLSRRLLSTAPATFGPALLTALKIRASNLHELGRMPKAVTDGELVVRFVRRLAARRSGREQELGMALHQLGVYLVCADRHTDGLRAYDEAIQLFQLPGADPDTLALALGNRDLCLRRLEQDGMVVLGPYPLCAQCEQTNGGLIAVRHRQRHIRANGREACVDLAMVDIITTLWKANCDTRSNCQDTDGHALVVPATGHASEAMAVLAGIGIQARNDNGELHFRLPQ
ncbi:tetratricopeptide repeat protein [Nocardia sp. NPDC051756]|uniref:tetratricopeptide repeat protein n=1 Tax=Nocardia sp. NPDC051756 TaxID=3154751 RepID=UPI00344623EA